MKEHSCTDICEVCGAEGAFKCSKCEQAFYCCADHQRQAWKGHKLLCSAQLVPQKGFVERGDARGVVMPAMPLSSPVDASSSNEVHRLGLSDGVCFCLNLDRRSDRWQRIEALVASHSWLRTSMVRVPAVDGRELEWPRLVCERLVSPEAELQAQRASRLRQATLGMTRGQRSCHLTLGACGCALSHREAWHRLVDSEARWAIILEDSVMAICHSFDRELAAVFEQLPAEWEVCYIGFHTGQLLPEQRGFTGPLIRLRSEDGWVPGLWGYLVSKAGAESLLAQTVPLLAQIDTVVGGIAAAGGCSFAVPPGQFLVYSQLTEESRDTDVQTFLEDMS